MPANRVWGGLVSIRMQTNLTDVTARPATPCSHKVMGVPHCNAWPGSGLVCERSCMYKNPRPAFPC